MMHESQPELRRFFDECMTILAKGIEPFVCSWLRKGDVGNDEIESGCIDARELLKIMNRHWSCFNGLLDKAHHGFVKVLLEFASTKWAHPKKDNIFTEDDITLSLEHVKRLLDAVCATESQMEIKKLKEEFIAYSTDNISGKKVSCPAGCGFSFKQWPLGWDGHAARCSELFGNSHEERKKDFLSRFGHLIKKHARKYHRPDFN